MDAMELNFHKIKPLSWGDGYGDYLLSAIVESEGESIAHIRLERKDPTCKDIRLCARVFIGVPHRSTVILEPERVICSDKLSSLPSWISVGGFYDDAIVRFFDNGSSPVWISLFAGRLEKKLSDFE